jgi:type III secretory pathway component EscV
LIWLLKDSSENQIYLYLISFLTNNSIDFFGVKDVRIFFDKMFDRFSNLRRLFLRQGFGCILRKHCLTSILNILMSDLD